MDENIVEVAPVVEVEPIVGATPVSSGTPPSRGLQFRVGAAPNKVLIVFSEEVSYVELLPQVAEEFAKMIRKQVKKSHKL